MKVIKKRLPEGVKKQFTTKIGKKVKVRNFRYKLGRRKQTFFNSNVYSNWLFPKEKPPSSQTPRLEQTDENKLVGEEEHEQFL